MNRHQRRRAVALGLAHKTQQIELPRMPTPTTELAEALSHLVPGGLAWCWNGYELVPVRTSDLDRAWALGQPPEKT